jgi:hypothetical protein
MAALAGIAYRADPLNLRADLHTLARRAEKFRRVVRSSATRAAAASVSACGGDAPGRTTSR